MNKFRQLSIHNQLAAIFCFLAMMAAFIVAWNGYSATRMSTTAVTVANQFEQADVPLSSIVSLRRLQIAELDFLRTTDSQYLYAHDQETDTLEMLIHVELLKTESTESRSQLYQFWRDQAVYEQQFETAVATMSNDPDAMSAFMQTSISHIGNMITYMTASVSKRLDALERMTLAVTIEQIIANLITIVGMIFFLWLGFAVLRLLNRRVNEPLYTLTTAATAVTDHQFNPESLQELTTRQDELGQLARSFLRMETAVAQREAERQQKIDRLRRRITQMG